MINSKIKFKMKKNVFILISLLALSACINTKSETIKNENTESDAKQKTVIGGHKDADGCISAAGETWSQLKQNCIQVFDQALRLDPVNVKENEAVFSAFILFNEEKNKAELFLPHTKSTSILKNKEEGIFENETYKFNSKESSLYIDDVKAYMTTRK